MINTIIVDDEPLALEILEAHIENIPELNLIAKCNNAIEANKALNEICPSSQESSSSGH